MNSNQVLPDHTSKRRRRSLSPQAQRRVEQKVKREGGSSFDVSDELARFTEKMLTD